MSHKIPADIPEYWEMDADRKLRTLSPSQLKKWRDCPEAAYAEYITRTWKLGPKPAFAEGNYMEALLFGDQAAAAKTLAKGDPLNVLSLKNGDASKKRQDLDAAAARALEQPAIREYLTGDKSVVVEGTLAGAYFRCILDVLNLEKKRIVDTKCMKALGLHWMTMPSGRNTKVPWWYVWSYHVQLALYREIVAQVTGVVCDVYLLAVTKSAKCDFDILGPFGTEEALAMVVDDACAAIPDAIARKSTGEGLFRCEGCDYCEETRFLTGPKPVNLGEWL